MRNATLQMVSLSSGLLGLGLLILLVVVARFGDRPDLTQFLQWSSLVLVAISLACIAVRLTRSSR